MDNKFLTDDALRKIALSFNIEFELLKTVLLVESSGSGFDKATGLIKIQFEPTWFKKFTNVTIVNGVDVESIEWAAYNKALAINQEAAMKATSWGLGQIMGFNHALAGYDDVASMVKAFEESEENQFIGMINFIKNTKLLTPLKGKDWRGFAKGYNGPNYEAFHYHTKLETTYNSLKK